MNVFGLKRFLVFQRRPRKPKKQEGVAILLVLVSIAILTVVVFEITFTSGVHSRLARSYHATGQAKYLAKSALNIGLIRLFFFMNILNLSKQVKLPFDAKDLAQLFNVPLPAFPFSDEMLALFPIGVRIGLEKFAKESKISEMPLAQFAGDIRGLSHKIPINFLDGEPERFSSTKFQALFRDLLLKMMEKEAEDNEEWEDRYGEYTNEELIAELINYIDLDNLRQPTDELEDTYFLGLDPPEFLRHRRFQFDVELELPRLWSYFLARRFARYVNFFAFYPFMNINRLPSTILKHFFEEPEDDQMEAWSERLTEKWFESWEDIQEFMNVQQLSFSDLGKAFKKVLVFDERSTFKIRSTGIVGDIEKHYSTIVVFKPSSERIKQERKRIKRAIMDQQKKIQETGEVDAEEIKAFRTDPFHFFGEAEERKEEDEEEESKRRPREDEGERDKGSGGKKSEKKKAQGRKRSIFLEPEEEMHVVFWEHAR